MADEAAKAEGAGPPGEVEELPTMPPAPRRDKAALRWAPPAAVPPPGREAARHPRPAPPAAPAAPAPVLPAPVLPAPVLPAPVREGPTAPVLVPPRLPGRPAPAPPGPSGQDGDEDAGGAGGGGGRHRRLVALLVLVGALAGLAAVAVAVVWRASEASVSRPTTPGASSSKPSPEELFESLLGTSATAHSLVQAAVDGACRTATPQSEARARLLAQIGQADALHVQLLQGAREDQAALSTMPSGRALSADLVQATDASVQADAGYRAWLEDLQATGCYSAPTNDVHYRAATAASLVAGQAEEELAAGWAGIASRSHLRSWKAPDL